MVWSVWFYLLLYLRQQRKTAFFFPHPSKSHSVASTDGGFFAVAPKSHLCVAPHILTGM
jgi:hypothetical protein